MAISIFQLFAQQQQMCSLPVGWQVIALKTPVNRALGAGMSAAKPQVIAESI